MNTDSTNCTRTCSKVEAAGDTGGVYITFRDNEAAQLAAYLEREKAEGNTVTCTRGVWIE
jgi:hypothetical protein